MKRMWTWFDSRLSLRETLMPMLQAPHPARACRDRWAGGTSSAVPRSLCWWCRSSPASVSPWCTCPAPISAYDSLLYLNFEQPLGWFLRALHYYAGSGMVVLVLIHMTQVFLHGAYKYPRELTWVVGVFLLLCTLGMFFTGQVLRWDPDAYWGLAVGGSMAGRVPVLGPYLVHLLSAAPSSAATR